MQLHFGPRQRLLYGVYHPAAEPRRRRGVLVLNPYGWEAFRAHRTLRTLAERLAGSGIDVLRFDYSCTGDSLGDTGDASFTDWVEDAGVALDELLAMGGLQRVSLVGLRMGALVATQLASRRPGEVDRVVLWAPPTDGGDVVDWVRAGPPAEAASFPMGPRLEGELRTAHPGELQSDPLVLATDPGAFRVPGGREIVPLPLDAEKPRCWVEDRDHGAGAVPVAVIGGIAEWLDA